MQEFKSLNGFSVKDAKARDDIENILNVQNGLKSNLSNPNLLINSDFRNPINQRGLTDYTNKNSNFYTIDRWCSAYTNVSIVSGGVKFSNETDNHNLTYVAQRFENILYGKYTVTVSVKEKSGHDIAVYFEGAAPNYLEEGLNVFTIEHGNIYNLSFSIPKGAYIIIEYVKLEQGELATPFVARPYKDEMALCKRFYQKSNGYEYFGNVMSMGSNAFRILSNYQDFRTVPTVKVPANTELLLYNRTDGQTISTNPVISEVIASDKGMLKITAPYASGASIPTGVVAIAQLSKELEFDAEIY